MDLGQRIHRLRQSRGLTQRELAGDRYSAAYVSSVESGRRSPSGDALRYFADRLGVTDEELVTGRPADAAIAMDLAFTTALASGEGFAEVAAQAEELGENRWRGWALVELGQLDDAAPLLASESPLDRVALVIARAAVAEPRYAIYLLEQTRDELIQQGFPDPEARQALHAHLAARYLELGDEQRAAVAAVAALDLAGTADGDGYLTTARSLIEAKRRNDATVALGQARAAYRRARLTPVIAACYRARGWQHRDAGALDAAAADLARARELYGDTSPGLDTAVELAEVHRRLGSASAATALLTTVLTHTPPPASITRTPPSDSTASAAPPASATRTPPSAAPAGSDSRRSSAVAREAVPLGAGDAALAGEVPLRVAHAMREAGLLAIDRGDEEEAERCLRQAISHYWNDGPRRDLARTLAVLANLLSGQGRAQEAAEALHDGLLQLETLAR